MDILGCTVAWGSTYIERAERVLRAWSKAHGDAPTRVVHPSEFTGVSDPYVWAHVRSRLLSLVPEDAYLAYMDVDTLCYKDTQSILDGSSLYMAKDADMLLVCTTEPEELWGSHTYFNTGYFWAKNCASTRTLFDAWWRLRHVRHGRYLDQSTFNLLLSVREHVQVQLLPAAYNCFMRGRDSVPEEAHVVHWAGDRAFAQKQDKELLRLGIG